MAERYASQWSDQLNSDKEISPTDAEDMPFPFLRFFFVQLRVKCASSGSRHGLFSMFHDPAVFTVKKLPLANNIRKVQIEEKEFVFHTSQMCVYETVILDI